MSAEKTIPVQVTSMYGALTRQGMVELQVGELKTVMSPTAAREIAGYLLTAAESAESDELFVRFFKDRIGLEDQQMVLMLRDFRRLRDEFTERIHRMEVPSP